MGAAADLAADQAGVSSALMCLEAAASEIGSGSASWPTVRSPPARSDSMRRRVASPRAWKMAFNGVG